MRLSRRFDDLVQLRSAVRAAGCLVVDDALAEGALAGIRSGSCRSRLSELVDKLDHAENADGDDEEIHHGLNEIANGDGGSLFALSQLDDECREIDAAGQAGDDGSDQIVDDAGDDAAECRADHNADCHVHDVALECKRLEFIKELAHNNASFLKCGARIHVRHPLSAAYCGISLIL